VILLLGSTSSFLASSIRTVVPSDSLLNRIGIIYQEFNLVQPLDVVSNIFLGKEIVTGKIHLNKKEMLYRSQDIMQSLGVKNFDCRIKVKYLSVAVQQLIEIAKAVLNDIDILVMDEPTAVLTEKETESLFKVIYSLQDRGLSIIYISHRIEEVIQLSDRISVLRDGKNVETLDNSRRKVEKRIVVNKMVGRELGDYFPQKNHKATEKEVLRVENLTSRGKFKNISFHVNAGETLGFSGLIGAGRSEIMMALFGNLPVEEGQIYINGKPVSLHSPWDAKKYGIALIPEDRKREENLCGKVLMRQS
jgi:ribose transport system ATP-binding protein